MLSVARSGLAAVLLSLAVAAHAQPDQNLGPVVGVLAIGTFPAGTDLVAVRSLLPAEVRETLELYLRGKIAQWFSLTDRPGVVFIVNAIDAGEARVMLEGLPLGRTHLMRFDLLPLAPFAPLGSLPGIASGVP